MVHRETSLSGRIRVSVMDKVARLPCEQPGLSCGQHLDLHPNAYWDGIWPQCLFPCPASCRKSDSTIRVFFQQHLSNLLCRVYLTQQFLSPHLFTSNVLQSFVNTEQFYKVSALIDPVIIHQLCFKWCGFFLFCFLFEGS